MSALTSIARSLGVIAFISWGVILAGCVKENPPGKQSPEVTRPPLNSQPPPLPASPEEPKNVFTKPPLPPPRNKNERTDAIRLSPNPSPAASPGPTRQLTNEAGLFAYYPQQRLMPEDFTIGPLQDGVSSTRDYLSAVETIRAFLDSVAKKQVDYALVLPAVKAEIQSVVSYPLAQGYVPQRWRIGKIAFESDDELRATIRLYRDEGATTGEIYLKKSDEGWRVSDLQAGFTLLGKKYERAKEPYTPGSYKFLLDDQ